MPNFEKEYYEQAELWSKDFQEIPLERRRIEEIIKTIPAEVESILDVGCGNGAFLNTLLGKYPKLVGLDRSEVAINYVKAEKVLGNIANLPFQDKSLDLITCLEVLEHLSEEDFKKGISELQRVSKKYIILTVPNNENLIQSFITCPQCRYRFHSFLHLRSFNKKKLRNLFSSFRLKEIKEIGHLVCFYQTFLVKIYRVLRPTFSDNAICPKCGYGKKNEKIIIQGRSGSKIKKILLFLPKILIKCFLSKKRPRWLLALYQRK